MRRIVGHDHLPAGLPGPQHRQGRHPRAAWALHGPLGTAQPAIKNGKNGLGDFGDGANGGGYYKFLLFFPVLV